MTLSGARRRAEFSVLSEYSRATLARTVIITITVTFKAQPAAHSDTTQNPSPSKAPGATYDLNLNLRPTFKLNGDHDAVWRTPWSSGVLIMTVTFKAEPAAHSDSTQNPSPGRQWRRAKHEFEAEPRCMTSPSPRRKTHTPPKQEFPSTRVFELQSSKFEDCSREL
ncbi:hypothetical protein FIBSPDRAFT_889026 [Athelia psychrophila]|uniref:Uncharacterized protein n=1 Tax=Athelia psychrophila TaxID=1759441 RepID=A0A166MUG7_9AGAM|nr:hypothetical protein FIBSPDRAFT_889026 [Fibularhizoctonia sp. CBS 109695]